MKSDHLHTIQALFFFFLSYILNYENMTVQLQETWKIQNKVTYSSTIYITIIF